MKVGDNKNKFSIWEKIKLSDYENHMRYETVFQEQTLNSIMKEQLNTTAKKISILGITSGNGLEHALDTTTEIYGIDVNKKFLDECKKRFSNLKSLKCLCLDFNDENILLPKSNCIIANLIIEYMGINNFIKTVKKIDPSIIKIVVLLESDCEIVSNSPYAENLSILSEIYEPIENEKLIFELEKIQFKKILEKKNPLPNGKCFLQLEFVK
ncbi:MAG: hypothetical protein ACRCSK_07595 [Fusobacteriaceae bacterium]